MQQSKPVDRLEAAGTLFQTLERGHRSALHASLTDSQIRAPSPHRQAFGGSELDLRSSVTGNAQGAQPTLAPFSAMFDGSESHPPAAPQHPDV
jgi:hypothetical protein